MINLRIALVVFTWTSLCILGCQKSNKAMEEFQQKPTSQFEGGASLPDGQSVQYSITANDEKFKVTLEIKSRDGCYHVEGSIPVDAMDSYDTNGGEQYYQLPSFKIQVKPKVRKVDNRRQFVHLILDQNATKTFCSPTSPIPHVTANEYKVVQEQNFFSTFNLTERQLDMAGPILAYGSNQVMYFFKKYDLGLIFKATTKELIGVSIPKHQLVTDYLFTLNRKDLKTTDISDGVFFPLILSKEDLQVNQRTNDIVKTMMDAFELMKNEPKDRRDWVINATWAGLFNN